MGLRLEGVTKRFGDFTAVEGISLTVQEGSVFGFLGSNGAGKTTTIRMVLRILLPDAGSITWRNAPVTEAAVPTFGYLPEERGLYPKMKVTEQLTYLALLHGLDPAAAQGGVSEWLERLELGEYGTRRLEQLSKGNQQKVQFAAAVVHRPRLLILDEPFSGLDPVNSQVLQESIQHLSEQGVTIIFSSHRLDQVEQLCSHVALIHRARIMVAGSLREVKRQSGRQMVRLVVADAPAVLRQLPGVAYRQTGPDSLDLEVPLDADAQAILQTAIATGPVRRFELGEPSLEEIYLEKVKVPVHA